MISLKTKYLGLELKNPIIVSSSGLTNSVEKIKKLEENGAGAVVLKSLFEEQIVHEAQKLSETSDYPEADDYVNFYVRNSSVNDYLKLIEGTKKEVAIPVIASINCVSSEEWIEFASKIQDAGADALEINVFYLPKDFDSKADVYESTYFELATKIKEIITIPVAFKLGNNFTNLLRVVNQLYIRKVDGVVLFNRFYAPDIDIKNNKIVSAEVFSSYADIRQSLRWVGIVSGKIDKIDIAASTGIHSGEAVIKQLLAGATVTQICSVLYKNGSGYIKQILNDIEQWMKTNNYNSIDEFRGKMSYKKIADPTVYERAQFMKYFSNYQ